MRGDGVSLLRLVAGAVRIVAESLGVAAVAVAAALRGGHAVAVVLVLARREAVHAEHARGVLPAVPAPDTCQGHACDSVPSRALLAVVARLPVSEHVAAHRGRGVALRQLPPHGRHVFSAADELLQRLQKRKK